jgi:adenosine deaminase
LALSSFFPLFGRFIYRLTDDASSVSFATFSVLEYFRSSGCFYLELRTTPRAVPSTGLTLDGYVDAVLAGIEAYRESTKDGADENKMLAKLILAVDRTHSVEVAEKVVDLAIRHQGLVVGVDLCGDPTKGDSKLLQRPFERARSAGLKITVHLGEVSFPPFIA